MRKAPDLGQIGLRLRSWTGELLAPVLATSTRGTIETFDAAEVAAKKSGDVSIDELGKSAKLPWEVDGRKWHTQDRIAHTGQPCRWEGQALQLVIDLIEKEKGLAPTNWNDRATIEVRADKGLGWFLHARSGGEWLLALCFRVKKGEFNTETLDASLGLKPLDEMNDVEAYGREPRVKARDLKTAWQEVTIKVWQKSEIDTPEFRQFLKQALKSYMSLSKAESANPDDLMPWKVLGRKWHLMKKGVPATGRGVWDIKIVERLLPVLESHFEKCDVDYGIRSKINWTRLKGGKPVAELHTKRSDGVDLILYLPTGKVTIGAIAAIGESQDIQPTRDGQDAVRIRFTKPDQLGNTALISLIIESSIP